MSEDYFEEQEIRDLARTFADENSYAIGGALEWSKFKPDRVVAFANAAIAADRAKRQQEEPMTAEDLDLCRQWFNSVQDTNAGYLNRADYALAERIYRRLGMRVPSSITDPLRLSSRSTRPRQQPAITDDQLNAMMLALDNYCQGLPGRDRLGLPMRTLSCVGEMRAEMRACLPAAGEDPAVYRGMADNHRRDVEAPSLRARIEKLEARVNEVERRTTPLSMQRARVITQKDDETARQHG